MLSWLVRGVLVAGVLSTVGCGTKTDTESTSPSPNGSPTAKTEVRQVDPEPATSTPQPTPNANPATATADTKPVLSGKTVERDPLHQSFVQATRAADEVPEDAVRPPDTLRTGTPTFKVLEQVTKTWDDIRFTDGQGNKIRYTAYLHTDEGVVEVALFPEQAPNHVRNFIALAQAGYYDGLVFERTRLEVTDEGKFETLEGGCPEGKGNPGMGSIGYWLKDELTDPKAQSHEPGSFGACRSEEPHTATGRFFICLSKAPFLDGNTTLFGKVVKGLDTVRKIYEQPIVKEDQDLLGRRPEKPVVIRKVTIQSAK